MEEIITKGERKNSEKQNSFLSQNIDLAELLCYGDNWRTVGRKIQGRLANVFGVESARKEYRIAKVIYGLTNPLLNTSQSIQDSLEKAFREYCESDNNTGYYDFLEYTKIKKIQTITRNDVDKYFKEEHNKEYTQYHHD